jgi:trehalose 6-phosphate phosphatase
MQKTSTDPSGAFLAPSQAPGGWALFLDIDGTLLDIAPGPDDVVVPASLAGDLAAARDCLGGAVALISGRAIESVDRLLTPLRLPAAGQHGAQMRYAADDPVVAAAAVDLSALRRRLTPVTAVTGVEIEDKGLSLAIHYRQAHTHQGKLRDWIEENLGTLDDKLEIIRGRCVIEIRPRGISKATAVAAFMTKAPFQGRRPIFIGDDKTDEDGFKAVTAAGGVAIQVGPRTSDLASRWMEDPAAVRRWLADLPQALLTAPAGR